MSSPLTGGVMRSFRADAGVSEPPKLYIAEPLKPLSSARYTIALFMRMPGVL